MDSPLRECVRLYKLDLMREQLFCGTLDSYRALSKHSIHEPCENGQEVMTEKNFDLDQYYEKNYNKVNATGTPNSIASNLLHKQLEKPFKSNKGFRILEVGANRGEHLSFVEKDFRSYLMTDIRDSFNSSPRVLSNNKRVNFRIADVQALPFSANSFDRVISTCVLHHLNQPLDALQEMRRVTKVGGTTSILIPNDPGILYRVLRGLTTLRIARKLGLLEQAKLAHAVEHRNHYLQLMSLSSLVFKNDDVTKSYFPIRMKSYNLNALTVLHVRKLAK